MRSLSGWLGVALVFGVSAACSSSGDDDGDGSGGSNGAGSGGTPALGGSSGTSAGVAGTGAGAGNGAGSGGGSSGAAGAGGGGTAGSSGAGTAGSSVTTPADFCQTALLCEDFEGQTIGAAPTAPWSLRATAGAAVVIDGAQHASGAKAVKLTTPTGSAAKSAMLRNASGIFPLAGNAFYGRMMYRLESQPTTDVHWNMIIGRGLVPDQTYRAEYRYGGQQPLTGGSQLMANYETPDWYANKSTPGSDCWHHSSGKVLPSAAWACVEWKFESNQMHFWLNGVALDDLTVADHGQGCVNAANDFTWTAPAFSQLELGWESFQTDQERTAYIDDVVIATTRIGCPSAD